MFNNEFNGVAKNPSLDLYPSHLKDTIDETNEWVFDGINSGGYRCGFARKQEPYNETKELGHKPPLAPCSRRRTRRRTSSSLTGTPSGFSPSLKLGRRISRVSALRDSRRHSATRRDSFHRRARSALRACCSKEEKTNYRVEIYPRRPACSDFLPISGSDGDRDLDASAEANRVGEDFRLLQQPILGPFFLQPRASAYHADRSQMSDTTSTEHHRSRKNHV
ncbi:unnamed protein product [Cochlearia groenlandica]